VILVIMGVAGAGKTTIGQLLARELGWPFFDADDFHPPSNVAKIAAGIPLTDADRAPWLAAIAAHIDRVRREDGHAVMSCSALKRAYRDVLVGPHRDRVRVVLLDGDEQVIAARMAKRSGHFMPPSLLTSQFQTLERPTQDEHVIVAPVAGSPGETVAAILEAL
jgi:carbohydrate kinase (thermoresistant glucokinase family)